MQEAYYLETSLNDTGSVLTIVIVSLKGIPRPLRDILAVLFTRNSKCYHQISIKP